MPARFARFAWLTLLGVLGAVAGPARAADLDREQLAKIDAAVEAALKRGDCPGAVVLVVQADEVVFRKAYGQRASQPDAEPMTIDTVFDLASLTKPIATATSIWVLIEQGKLKLSDPVSRHWPAFAANGKEAVTIKQLLLHTSGLTADNALADYADGPAQALDRIAALKLEAPAGTRFRYSDVGFIVLGHLVQQVGGLPVDRFARKHIFEPLKMTDTTFAPEARLHRRIAPTGLRAGRVIRGEVHDPRAYQMGGIAGHAGLFATADDLARYSRMLLRGGELDGQRILTEATVKRFLEPHEVPIPGKSGNTTGLRSLGWDVDTSYSTPRGEVFAKGDGFGHTGFTGTSLWIDPGTKTAVIVLTNRVHPNDKGNVTQLRRDIGTIVARAVGKK
jgi:CubicO group peptidase (beta-lactamase class C family)